MQSGRCSNSNKSLIAQIFLSVKKPQCTLEDLFFFNFAVSGSEDLLLLLAYTVMKAQATEMYSEFEFISALLPEALIRGEAGYVLATLQTSLNYLIELKGPPEIK